MSDNRNGKKTIWMYAVILFTSAFIVLLLTAYSQIKFNKNIIQYRSQLSSEEQAKIGFQMNWKTALEENSKLKIDLDSMKKQLAQINSDQEIVVKKAEDAKIKNDQIIKAYETLLKAEDEYRKNNLTECASLLYGECTPSVLSTKALERYNFLVESTYKPASKQLYKDGYKYYKAMNYKDAISKLDLSIKLELDEYYSDDCYYFIAYSYYRLGDTEQSKKALEILLQKYPKTNYIKEAEKLKEQLGG